MKTIYYVVLMLLLLCSACNSKGVQKEQATEAEQTTTQGFELPQIPAMYTTPEQRTEFLVKHYWEHFNFSDTSYIHLPEITEQAYADFLNTTNYTSIGVACEGMKILMNRAKENKTMFDYFTSMADKYLYDPNSPYRNEELYIAVLEQMIETDLLTDTDKIRPQYRLNLAKKNRLGTKALNFTYTTSSGKQGTMYALRSEYLLIYINNPGCHACGEITEELKHSEIVQQLLANKRLTILCIYPDEDLTGWKDHLGDFPAEWINGYDKDFVIRDNNLYDLKAIPSLYLLDKGKTVLLKDATFVQIEQYFNAFI